MQETWNGFFGGDLSDTVEKVWLSGPGREACGGVDPVLDEGEMHLPAQRRA